jgi:hypothetical protein
MNKYLLAYDLGFGINFKGFDKLKQVQIFVLNKNITHGRWRLFKSETDISEIKLSGKLSK